MWAIHLPNVKLTFWDVTGHDCDPQGFGYRRGFHHEDSSKSTIGTYQFKNTHVHQIQFYNPSNNNKSMEGSNCETSPQTVNHNKNLASGQPR
jgi:hypothetical protein